MPKEEWGTKRVCPTTGKRFYDLNADPVVSPYTGEIVPIETGKTRTMVADAEDAQTSKAKAKAAQTEDDEDIVLDDEDDEDDPIADDVLDDDDDDTVSLDELADVAEDKDDDS
ncbi:MAG: TIGR02300 family protein [Paracoccaceae bacterium]